MACDDGWLCFVGGAFENEYQIHPTREVDWIRRRTPAGNWAYMSGFLRGDVGKTMIVGVGVEGKEYSRHRLLALAKDGTADGLSKFRDGKNNPVLHGKRRRENERPDDSPENVRFGTHGENRNDPGNKKMKRSSRSLPVRLTLVATGVEKSVNFESIKNAAAFLDVNAGSLCHYLNNTNGVKNMPGSSRGVWDAAYTEFELPDAVRLVRASASLYLSPTRPNELFRELKTGKFTTTKLETTSYGYTVVRIDGGKREMLHRLVVETLDPGAFEEKMGANPWIGKDVLQVDHVDGDKYNNAISNLKVVTPAEHARKHAFDIDWVDDGWVLDTFECAADVVEAVRGTNGEELDPANVHKVCHGVYTHTGGRVFEWTHRKCEV